MSEQAVASVNPYAHCEPGTEVGEYLRKDGLPRVWDGMKWLSPKGGLEAGILDLREVGQAVPPADLEYLIAFGGSSCLWRIPDCFVLDLVDSEYCSGRDKLQFFDDLAKAKAEFWAAIQETVESGEVSVEEIGRKVHARSVYTEDACGPNWETAEVYDCLGFAVIDYGSFPDTCKVPRFECHGDVDDAIGALESFVDELEGDAQGNIDYRWRTTSWDEENSKNPCITRVRSGVNNQGRSMAYAEKRRGGPGNWLWISLRGKSVPEELEAIIRKVNRELRAGAPIGKCPGGMVLRDWLEQHAADAVVYYDRVINRLGQA